MSEKERAVELFRQGYNCSQSVFVAFAYRFGIDEDNAKKMSAGLGGGLGRMREVCGAVSGAAMVIGSICAPTDGKDSESKQRNYELVREFARRFTQKNGSIICRELLGLQQNENTQPNPTPRSETFYQKRPCSELVGIAARVLDEHLSNR